MSIHSETKSYHIKRNYLTNWGEPVDAAGYAHGVICDNSCRVFVASFRPEAHAVEEDDQEIDHWLMLSWL